MATSLLDRVGLGNGRAVANAEQAILRRHTEDRIVADLIAALARHDAPEGSGSAARADDAGDAVGSAA